VFGPVHFLPRLRAWPHLLLSLGVEANRFHPHRAVSKTPQRRLPAHLGSQFAGHHTLEPPARDLIEAWPSKRSASAFSYTDEITTRDNNKMVRFVTGAPRLRGRAPKADPKMQHGEWGTMVESDLPFNRHTAHKLMQIARDKRLTNVSQGKHLPPSWTTLYELTKLDDDTFDQKLRDGSINPEMQRKDVARANRILNRERDRQRVENLPPIRGSAKTGKQVVAISALSACDPDQAMRAGGGRHSVWPSDAIPAGNQTGFV
jgi:hypothetical protein